MTSRSSTVLILLFATVLGPAGCDDGSNDAGPGSTPGLGGKADDAEGDGSCDGEDAAQVCEDARSGSYCRRQQDGFVECCLDEAGGRDCEAVEIPQLDGCPDGYAACGQEDQLCCPEPEAEDDGCPEDYYACGQDDQLCCPGEPEPEPEDNTCPADYEPCGQNDQLCCPALPEPEDDGCPDGYYACGQNDALCCPS